MTLFGGVTQLHPNEYAVRERSAALGVGSASEEVSGRVGEASASEHCRQSGKGERESGSAVAVSKTRGLSLSLSFSPLVSCQSWHAPTRNEGREATKEGAKLSPAKIAPRITRGAPSLLHFALWDSRNLRGETRPTRAAPAILRRFDP